MACLACPGVSLLAQNAGSSRQAELAAGMKQIPEKAADADASKRPVKIVDKVADGATVDTGAGASDGATVATGTATADGIKKATGAPDGVMIDAEAAVPDAAVILTLDDALRVALDQNVSVKLADMEVDRARDAKRVTYASLFPQIDGSASYQRTIKKQVMYMDFDLGSFGGMGGGDSTTDPSASTGTSAGTGSGTSASTGSTGSKSSDNGGGIEVGRWNTFMTGVSASLPLVNAQLWKNLQISGQDVDLAVEKARASHLGMVTQVKQAYYTVLLAKEALKVYKEVYENALANFRQTEMRFNVQKASELDYNRAKATVQNAIPQVYESANSVALALWQLKAVLGMDLDTEIDVAGDLADWAGQMFYDIHSNDDVSLESNSTMRQLAIQVDELANAIKLQQYSSLPSLALGFNYSINAMTNDFNFSEYHWSPYSYVGLSLQIPIFAGGRRYHAVRQARTQHDELKLQRRDTERQLQIAIRQYLSQMETKMKSYQSAQVAEETARKAYDIAVKSYNVGRSTITDLNSAQLSLTQAQLAVSQAIYDFVIAKANLEEALGRDFIED